MNAASELTTYPLTYPIRTEHFPYEEQVDLPSVQVPDDVDGVPPIQDNQNNEAQNAKISEAAKLEDLKKIDYGTTRPISNVTVQNWSNCCSVFENILDCMLCIEDIRECFSFLTKCDCRCDCACDCSDVNLGNCD